MNVAMIGLGKLGLPVATAMASKGLTVYGVDPYVKGYPDDLSYEDGFAECVEKAEGRVKFVGLAEAMELCSVLFVAVATPHDPQYEGITPIPDERVDFDYSHLRHVAQDIRSLCDSRKYQPMVSVISTVLPGTMDRYVIPRLGGRAKLVYNPSFIAMGTTIRDFLDPEFMLIGGDTEGKVRAVYEACGIDTFYETSVNNAELIKVAYNTFIGLKLAFNPFILSGMVAYGVSLVVWIMALSRVPVSIAYPMLSIGYGINAFIAWHWFGEALSAQKLLGIGCIVLGVYVITRSA